MLAPHAELDLPGLQVGHAHDVLVADRRRPVAVELLEGRELRSGDHVEVGRDPRHDKTIGEDERANAEWRAMFVGLWPPMFWLIADAVRRREERLRRRRPWSR
ncbi:MAG: hypothetical protein M3P44_17040 [Actinomycetota bacterium]|nr:hypothetical protein [Actinomycetota bacterium]